MNYFFAQRICSFKLSCTQISIFRHSRKFGSTVPPLILAWPPAGTSKGAVLTIKAGSPDLR
jgi:hypothetical protein